MDAKITKKRLGDFLSYEWIKIVALAVAVILVWLLLFKVTATPLTADQLFTVINYQGTSVGEDFNEYSKTLISNNVFSYEVDEVSAVDITTQSSAIAEAMLENRFDTGEGDVMYISNVLTDGLRQVKRDDEGNALDKDGNITTDESAFVYEEDSQMRAFLNSVYYNEVIPLEDVTVKFSDGKTKKQEGLLTLVRAYLETYFGTNLDEELNIEQMESDFRARVKERKDKRFRNEKLIVEGLKKEAARLQSYLEGYHEFMKNLEDGVIVPTESRVFFNNATVKGNFGLNICPDARMDKLNQAVYYTEEKDGATVKSAKDIHVLFLNLKGSRKEYHGEKLLFINHLVETYAPQA